MYNIYQNQIAIILYTICDGHVKIAMFMGNQFRWTLACSRKEKYELTESAIPRIVEEVFGVESIPCAHVNKVTVRGQGNVIKNIDYFIAKCEYQMLIPSIKMADEVLDIGWFEPEEAKSLKMDTGHAPVFFEALVAISNHCRQLKSVA